MSMKTSLEMQRISRLSEQQNPGHNYLPTPGQPYTDGTTAYAIMFASPDGIGIWIEVEYLDEDGNTQKRRLGKGIWPIVTTQINGYRTMDNLQGALNTDLSSNNFEISVLM